MVFDTILDTIRRLNEGGLTILLVEQAVQDSLAVAHRCYLLGEGRIMLSGDPKLISQDPRVRDVYLGQASAAKEHVS